MLKCGERLNQGRRVDCHGFDSSPPVVRQAVPEIDRRMNMQPVGPRKAVLQPYQSPHALPRQGFAPPPQPIQFLAENPAAFWIGAVFTFLTFSHSIEFIDTTGRLHLAMLNAALGAMVLIATGNAPAMLLSKQGKYLTCFTFWVFIGLPFSMWKGGSVNIFLTTYIKSYISFFLIGGLIFGLSQMRKILVILALGAAALSYITFRSGVSASDDRVSASYGSLGNANDLATTILMGLPFLVFVVRDKKTSMLFRFLAAPMVLILLAIVLKTGSRGGLVGIVVMILFAFTRVSMANRMKMVAVGLIFAAIAPFVVSKDLRERYMTIFGDEYAGVSANTNSAALSSNARREVMKHAVILTVRHPVFGVGLGQLAIQSANMWIEKGEQPLWFTAHDIYLLVSSETGIPAFILYLVVIGSCFKDLFRLSKMSRQNPELEEISNMAFSILMSLLAFSICGIFNTDAFSIQLPMLAALTAALVRTSAPQIAAADKLRASLFVPPAPFVNRRLARPPAPAGY
jgi:O-antigen ligase